MKERLKLLYDRIKLFYGRTHELDRRYFHFLLVLMVIGVLFIVIGIILFAIPQATECYFFQGCYPKYWGIGFGTGFFGIILLVCGIKGVNRGAKRQREAQNN